MSAVLRSPLLLAPTVVSTMMGTPRIVLASVPPEASNRSACSRAHSDVDGMYSPLNGIPPPYAPASPALRAEPPPYTRIAPLHTAPKGAARVQRGGSVQLSQQTRADQSDSMISRMRAAVSDGVLPTFTPAASRASFLACAVPAEPETIAPA